ncbi:amidohydrolase family protein [Pseudohaliea sp.]|uniref:amidohydrolase family protein n=1 Tax=Pseudohaliea sp. TaxID=2740289 RepID=UPI0032EB6C1E
MGEHAHRRRAEGEFLKNSTHPRDYGMFPRVLGHYVREGSLLSLAEAVRKASALPAENLSPVDRGRLVPGFYADVVVFDPETITDRATCEAPHQYSTGVEQVFVNGGRVIADGAHTGATPGRVVRGPGWTGWE